MAKLAFIVTPNIEATEAALAQIHTKAFLVDAIDHLKDGDVAIISDQSLDAEAVLALEVSAHVLMVASDHTFNRAALQDLIECNLIMVKDDDLATQVMRPGDHSFFEIDNQEEREYIEAFLHE